MTKVASMGMWVPVHRDEWDGETPREIETPTTDSQSREVVFRGSALPWKPGIYEVRWFYVKMFARSNWRLDPLPPRREIQRYGHHRADRSIRSVCNYCPKRISAVI